MATLNAKLKKQDSEDIVISMNGVNKWFGNFHVLRDINLNVRKGERIIICGPSGSGKSTVIRCLNALEHHQGGDINIYRPCYFQYLVKFPFLVLRITPVCSFQ